MKYLLFILSLFISINANAQNKKSLLRDGNKLYTDSSYNNAEMKYRKSLEKDQEYFNASFNLADAIYKQQRYKESSALFDALKDNANSKTDLAKIYHNLGNSLFKEQKLEEAINAYKNALRINPNDEDTRYNLALTTKQRNQQENNENQQENKEDQQENKEDQQENKEDQQQNKEDQQQNKEDQQEKREKQKEDISKETAEKMLEAIEEKEKNLQEKLQKKKVKGKRVKVLKDW